MPPPTATPLVSFSVTVMVAELTPSATAVVGAAATVEFVADVGAVAWGEPSPAGVPESVELALM